MKKSHLIKVTKPCIIAGHRNNPYYCPVALAIKRRFRKADVAVGDAEVWFSSGCCALPGKVTTWIERFDAGRKVKPFEFRLVRTF